MLSIKRLSLLVLSAVLLVLAAACGDDPTATPTMAPPDPAATPTTAPDPTATPTTAPQEPTATPRAREGVIEIEAIRYEDGLIELRVGPEPRFGYEANARIKSNEEDGWVIRLDVGDLLVVGEIEQSSSRSSEPHSFTIKDLGVSFPLDESEAGGSITPWKFDFFDEGAYAVGDSHGDDHGTAWVLVGEAEIPMGTQPLVYTLDEIRVRDTVHELRMGDTTFWGYDAGLRVRTDDGDTGTRDVNDITVTIAVGDTIEFPDGFSGSSSNTETHFVTIDALGIDIEVAIGNRETALGFKITPTEVGTYLLYCSAHPDSHGGNFFIVVTPPAAPAV
ncbi:MAG: hypothetical protein IIB37_12745 [Gemmatimonadetes bacterium]|nr:hypothetical protein [Gemmatimonadota bacterium]